MGAEWRQYTAGELADARRNALVGGPFGSNLVGRDYVDAGVPVIRGQNMGARWVAGDFAYVTAEKAESLRANLTVPTDVVLTQRGTLGQVSVVPGGSHDRYVVSQSQMKLTVDHDVADPLFVYYAFSGPHLQDYIRKHAIQTGVPHINLGILRDAPVLLPPLPEQRAIAYILGTLDDKIELNRRMNETLEGMARALFKSWFVDFDPVRAKIDGRGQPGESLPGLPADLYDLFPDRLVESELGEVPEGWRVRALGNLISLRRESVKPRDHVEEVFAHYSIPAFDEGRVPKLEEGASIKSNKYVVSPTSVLVSKLNPRIKRVWLPAASDEHRPICSTEFLVAESRARKLRPWLYCLLDSDHFQSGLGTLVTGTSGSHQRVRPQAFLALEILAPPEDVWCHFGHEVGALFRRTELARTESRTLATLRDTLLPKLISGELRVPDAERIAERAG